jgi:hypothetical protein
MRVRLLFGLVVVLAAGGCGSRNVAPVSGRVTLNGAPLANATVAFQPIAKEGTVDAGLGSTGKTDANGEYTLKTAKGQNGAVVGKHRVMISVVVTEAAPEDDSRKRGGPPQKEIVPRRYNGVKTELSFDVPAGGTT